MSQQQVFDFGPPYGTYSSICLLGKGAFSAGVYKAKNVKDGSDIKAVKQINISQLKAEDAKAARNEVTLMSQISDGHPHIVRFYSSYEDKGTLNILLQYADGGDATQLLNEKADPASKRLLDEAVIGRLFCELVSAVLHLHNRRCLHRDLKLANIFLCKRQSSTNDGSGSFSILLGDFGISRVLQESALARTFCGTPYYYSPELCLNKPYNNKTDIWSLGCILYELSTQRRAFDANNLKALMARICRGKYESVPAQYSKSLQQLVDGMLATNPGQRLSARQVASSEFVRKHCAGVFGLTSAVVAPSSSSSASLLLEKQRREYEYQRELRQRHMAAAGDNRGVGGGGEASKPGQQPSSSSPTRGMVHITVSPGRAIAAAAAKEYVRKQGIERLVSGAYEPMKYVKRRTEILDYDNQQRYVQGAQQVVQQRNDMAELRSRHHEERVARIGDLRKKLEEIEARHNALRFERDAARQMEQQQQQRQQSPSCSAPSGDIGPPRAEPTAAELRAFYNNRNRAHGVAPWAKDEQADAQQLALIGRPLAPSLVKADTQFQGRRELQQANVDEMLAVVRGGRGGVEQGSSGGEAERAKQLWALQKQRIAAARELEQLEKHDDGSNDNDGQRGGGAYVARGAGSAPAAMWKKPREPSSQQRPPRPRNRDDASAVEANKKKQKYLNALQENPDWDPDDDDDDDDDSEEEGITTNHDSNDDQDDDDSGEDASHPPQPQLFNADYDGEDDDDDRGEKDANGAEEAQDDYFEDAPAPPDLISKAANMIQRKFTFDGRTLQLPGVDQSSPLAARVEALRQFLADGLGSETLFKQIHGSVVAIECVADIDDAEKMMRKLQADLGPASVKLLDLIIQLRACEECLASGSG